MRYEAAHGTSWIDDLTFTWLRYRLLLGVLLVGVLIICAIVVGPLMGLLVGSVVFAAVILIVGVCVLSDFLATLVHEFGHCVAAWASGFRLYRCVVSGLVLREKHPYTVYSCEFRSYVVAAKRHPTLIELLFLDALGPIFNLLFAYGAWTLAEDGLRLNRDTPPFLIVLALVGGNLWVAVSSILYSDGKSIIKALSSPYQTCRSAHLFAVFTDYRLQRPRDYSDADLMIMEIFTASPAWQQHLIYFWRALDGGNTEAAAIEIATAFDSAKSYDGQDAEVASVHFEMAMFAARFLNDRMLSDEALALGEAIDMDNHNRSVAVAAREYGWGSSDEAIKIARASLTDYLADAVFPDHRVSAIEWYQRIIPELAVDGMTPSK